MVGKGRLQAAASRRLPAASNRLRSAEQSQLVPLGSAPASAGSLLREAPSGIRSSEGRSGAVLNGLRGGGATGDTTAPVSFSASTSSCPISLPSSSSASLVGTWQSADGTATSYCYYLDPFVGLYNTYYVPFLFLPFIN
uniref:Uncharacterized protein n=1 Tax=Setaria italica TaxID=4555 RepID=K3ZXY5_SETIT